MTLSEFIKPLAGAELDEFATKCGTTAGYLKLIASGVRTPKIDLAVSIDRETGGRVACEKLIPGVDWPYLRRKNLKRAKK